MTINLITGKTGNGKSLLAVTQIEQRRIEEGRDVYYNGIPDLKLPWIHFENTKEWHKLPLKAIIVFDEAQHTFRPRPNGSAVPEFVAALETHRKQGHDLYLLTQHPTFVDSHVRKLVDSHQHLMRKFGDEKSVIHKWNTSKDDCDKNRADSIKTEWEFPKEAYSLYKSADAHTIKKSVPFRYYLKYIIPLVIVALIVGAYYAFSNVAHKGESVAIESKEAISHNVTPSPRANKEDDPNFWYTQNIPRIATMPSSAPKYDEVTKPKVAPYPAACVAMGKRCQCYTQQATKMQTDEGFCRQIVANGYFIDFQDQVQPQQTVNTPTTNQPQTVPDKPVLSVPALGNRQASPSNQGSPTTS